MSVSTSTSVSSSQSQFASGSKSSHAAAAAPKPGVATATKRKVRHVPWTEHTLRQLKLVLPGAAITYYLGTLNDFWGIIEGNGGFWARLAGFGASGLGFLTVTLFLYVLLTPWLTGEEPDYQTWRESGILSSVIPVLTGSIVVGWLLAVSTLGQWSPMGYVKGTIGVSAFYALTFGLLGLIPVPKASRKRHD
ncbi:hypothetical protein JR316_0006260 [Psilocybe cubensis]|uniref:Uncharacterized protein n=2 Tax=Psilocybe cubensis TaxID=181762 RepID=A0ACB8H1F4_PSICU|nr:hypothetical protein JR316_0006260 [Psilocybe cubensis]KAH9481733.1 hypothetical protein JR316_0006260 [Psilocybe cubensis]